MASSRWRERLTTSRIIVAAVVIALLAVIVSGGIWAGQHAARTEAALPAGHYAVTTGQSDCGVGWEDPTGGDETITFRNTDVGGVEVYLQNAQTQAVYVDLEGFGAGATDTETVRLADGTYRIVCIPDDGTPQHGVDQTITGAADIQDATPGIVPVTAADLLPTVSVYQHWIEQRLPSLVHLTRALHRDVSARDNRAARRDWLAAHRMYESLGAAYGAFGDDDSAINGMPASGRSALDDPDLTGFHRVEALLWTNADPSTIAPVTAQLVADVENLAGAFPDAQIEPLDIGLRSHEILENAIQFELTGAADAGSHTTLATVDANLTGTLAALDPLHDILSSRDADLAETYSWISRSQKLIESYDHDGSWTPLQSLSTRERETLDATLSRTVELLSEVASITDPRPQW